MTQFDEVTIDQSLEQKFNSLKVTELTEKECQESNGGWWIPALMLLGGMINDAQNNPDDFQAGLDAWN